jgi:type IV secretion system protein VirB4
MSERGASEAVPWGRLLNEWTVQRDRGAQIRVFQVAGLPWELETNFMIGRLHLRLNKMHQSLSNPRLTFGVHVCKLMQTGVPRASEMHGYWPRQYDNDFREKILGRGLSQNVIYVSLALEPAGLRAVNRRISPKGRTASRDDMRQMDEAASMLMQDLSLYGITPLGLRAEQRPNGVLKWYSQAAEAAGVILYGRYERIPVPAGNLGNAILRHRPVFTRKANAYEVRTSGSNYFGTIFGVLDWPEGTEPGILNNLLDCPYSVVMSATFGYRSRSAARSGMKVKQGQMRTSKDESQDKAEDLTTARQEHNNRRWVLGEAHLSFAVYDETLGRLAANATNLNGRLVDAGFSVTREDYNLDAAWAAQIPGGWHKIKRKGDLTSRNYAAIAPLHNYPVGDPNPRWGDYVWDFMTTGHTLYRHNMHRGEIASLLLLGMTGEGKSALANTLMIGCTERLNARGVIFDKDHGSKPCVLAAGGTYLELRYGRDSGLAPLPEATDCADDHGHLVRLFTSCIKSRAPKDWTMTPEENTRLERAIGRQLRIPPAMRSWAAVRQVMGWRNPQGAGAWLEPWCEGQPLGWVFANPKSRVDFSQRLCGFDTTEIIGDPEICGPMMAHLTYRVRKLVDGTPFVLFWDEVPAALKIPQFEDMIGDDLATIRKKEGAVILASQGPRALLDSKIGHVIREQTPTKISFANKDAVWEDYEEIGFSPVMFRMVTEDFTRGRKRFVISRAGASVVCDFDLTAIKEHLWMVSGRTSTSRELDLIMAEHGTDPEVWVPIFMQRAPVAAAREAAERARAEAAKAALAAAERTHAAALEPAL